MEPLQEILCENIFYLLKQKIYQDYLPMASNAYPTLCVQARTIYVRIRTRKINPHIHLVTENRADSVAS